jgi:hypothetical protein
LTDALAAGIARRSAAAEWHLVPELVRPAVGVIGRRTEIDVTGGLHTREST